MVDGDTFRWKVAPPLPNTDCPLCSSWHVVVLSDPEHELVSEWEVEIDPQTRRALAVTPAQVAEQLRASGRRPREAAVRHPHERPARRQRHRTQR